MKKKWLYILSMSIFLIAQICSFAHHHEDLYETHNECASCLFMHQVSAAKAPAIISITLKKTNFFFLPDLSSKFSIIYKTKYFLSLAPPLF